jgi:hypothetical protein
VPPAASGFTQRRRLGERTHGRRHRDTALAASVCRAALLAARAAAVLPTRDMAAAICTACRCAPRSVRSEPASATTRVDVASSPACSSDAMRALSTFIVSATSCSENSGSARVRPMSLQIVEHERHSDTLLLLGAHRAQRRNEHVEQPMHETELERLRVQRAERPIVERAEPLGSNSALIEHNTPQNIDSACSTAARRPARRRARAAPAQCRARLPKRTN